MTIRSRVRRRIATVESPKVPRGEYAHQQDARTSGDDLICGVEIEISDASDEEVSEDEVRKSPKHVDGRRGKALAWRFGEGTLKGPSHHAADEVRNGIGEESAAEQIGYVVKPVQDWALHIRRLMFLHRAGYVILASTRSDSYPVLRFYLSGPVTRSSSPDRFICRLRTSP